MPPEKLPSTAVNPKPMGNGKALVQAEYYEGTIPHPKLMKEWEDLVPGSAKSIFLRFENQSDHRIASEKSVIRAHNFKLYMGPIFAFIIAMTAIIGGVWIAIVAQPYVGGFVSLSGIGAIIAPFLLNEWRSRKSQEEAD